jgi:hypothetical protein
MIYQAPVMDSGSPVGGCTGTRTDTLFPVVAVDNVGNVFAEWSDGINVFYESSSDHGTTWNGKTDGTGPPTQVSLPFGTANCTNTTGPVCGLHTALFPWMSATGNGHVDFVWYGSPTTVQPGTNPDYGDATSPWSVFFAETFNGLANVGGNATAPSSTRRLRIRTPTTLDRSAWPVPPAWAVAPWATFPGGDRAVHQLRGHRLRQ